MSAVKILLLAIVIILFLILRYITTACISNDRFPDQLNLAARKMIFITYVVIILSDVTILFILLFLVINM